MSFKSKFHYTWLNYSNTISIQWNWPSQLVKLGLSLKHHTCLKVYLCIEEYKWTPNCYYPSLFQSHSKLFSCCKLAAVGVFSTPQGCSWKSWGNSQIWHLLELLENFHQGPVKGAGALIIEPCKANKVSETCFNGGVQGLAAADGHAQAITAFSVCGQLMKTDPPRHEKQQLAPQSTANGRSLLSTNDVLISSSIKAESSRVCHDDC